jgi:hypothetical protein
VKRKAICEEEDSSIRTINELVEEGGYVRLIKFLLFGCYSVLFSDIREYPRSPV